MSLGEFTPLNRSHLETTFGMSAVSAPLASRFSSEEAKSGKR